MAINICNSDILDLDLDVLVLMTHCKQYESKEEKDLQEKFPYAKLNRKYDRRPGSYEIFGGPYQKMIIYIFGHYYPGRVSNRPYTLDGKSVIDDHPSRLYFFRRALNTMYLPREIKSIGFPYNIGCGILGGDWAFYKEAIDEFSKSVHPIKTYIVNPGKEEGEIYGKINKPYKKNKKYTWKDSTLIEYLNDNPIGGAWDEFINEVMESGDIQTIQDELLKSDGIITPPLNKIYDCFRMLPVEDVKVIIIGQDPYPGEDLANGIAFSVSDGVKPPQSLKNIITEAKSEGFVIKPNLEYLVKQGVLLINTSLTLQEFCSGSHMKIWNKKHAPLLMKFLNERCGYDDTGVVVVMWGNHAKKYGKYFDDCHTKIESSHPSPLGVNKGFRGSKPFTSINNALEKLGYDPIDWNG